MSGLFNSLGGNDYGAVLNVICWVKPSSAASCWIYIDCLAMVGTLLVMTEWQQQAKRKKGDGKSSASQNQHHFFFATPWMHKGVVDNPGSIIDEIMEKLLNNLEKRWSGAFIYPLPTPTYFYSVSGGCRLSLHAEMVGKQGTCLS